MGTFAESPCDSADMQARDAAPPGDFDVDIIEFFRGNDRDLQLVN
jgi:hypothetical protein